MVYVMIFIEPWSFIRFDWTELKAPSQPQTLSLSRQWPRELLFVKSDNVPDDIVIGETRVSS